MIGDIVSNVIVSYKADTSDMKKGLRELQGEERKLAEEQLKQSEARNKSLEQWKSGLATVGVALGVAGGIAKLMWDDYKDRAEEARLKTAAFGVDLDLLGKAALGTKSRMEILGDAAKFNNGVFKLTSQEMAAVERAMIALNRKGYEMEDVQKKVLEAVTQLKTDGMRDLGIAVNKAGASMETADGRMKIFGATMKEIDKLSQNVASSQLTMAEETEKATARMKDAWRDFKKDWITGRTSNVGGVEFDVIAGIYDGDYRKKIVSAIMEQGRAAAAAGKSLDQYAKDMGKATAAQAAMFQTMQVLKQRYGYKSSVADDLAALAKAASAAARSGGGPAAKPTHAGYSLGATEYGAPGVGSYDGYSTYGAGASLGYGGYGDASGGVSTGMMNTASWQAELESYRAGGREQQSKLEKIFGPVSEFDAYAKAFETLQSVTTSAFSAWIDGSMGAGEAFKKFMGDSLKGTATFLFGESIKFGLMAISSIIPGPFFNPTSASAYAATAIKYAAGAALVGGLAKGLIGGGGGSTGGGASTGGGVGGGVPAYSGGGSGSGEASRPMVVVYGQDYSQDSARQRQLRAAKVFDDAKQVMGGAVSYS